MAKSPAIARRAKAAAETPEPAVMAAGASEENALEGKGTPPADLPTVEGKPVEATSDSSTDAGQTSSASEGFRDEKGHFTGNPPTDAERLDAICDLLEKNGMSLPKVLQRAKE